MQLERNMTAPSGQWSMISNLKTLIYTEVLGSSNHGHISSKWSVLLLGLLWLLVYMFLSPLTSISKQMLLPGLGKIPETHPRMFCLEMPTCTWHKQWGCHGYVWCHSDSADSDANELEAVTEEDSDDWLTIGNKRRRRRKGQRSLSTRRSSRRRKRASKYDDDFGKREWSLF